jgi:hypothetical protein
MQLVMKKYHDQETSRHKQLNQLMPMVDDEDEDDNEHDCHCMMLHVHQ